MKRNLIIKQDGYKECGAASLLSIIRYYGGNISINKLVEMTHTDKTGTSFYHLKEASEKLGLEAIGYKIDNIETMLEINKFKPFICQLINQNYEHFVVVYTLTRKKVILMDPAIGERIISLDEFKRLWTGYCLIFSPIKKLLFYKEKKYLNKLIITTLTANKSICYNILLLSIIYTIASCLYAMYFQTILDYVIDTNINNLVIITFFFALTLLLKCISNFFRTKLLIYLNQKLDCSIFLNTFQKLLLLPFNYYKNKTTGEITSRINDLIYVKNIINKIILTVLLDIIIFICSGITLFSINPTLFTGLIIIISIYLPIFYIFRPILKEYTNKCQQHNAKIESYLIETINGYETIKNMSNENNVNDKMETLYVAALNDSFIYENISNLELFTKDIIYFIGILLIEFLGFNQVFNNELSLGTFLTFTLLTNFFIDPIKNIIDLSKEYYYANNALNRVNHLLDIDTENLSTKTNYTITGDIKLNNLTFSYNGEKNILNNINLNIYVGNKIMILGNSGSGKSTLLKLLLKYYPIARDMLYINNIDINDLTIHDVRTNTTTLTQNEILYNDTIKNNILLNRNIGDDKFLEICRLTYVDDFVKNMFLGYDTMLEENGLNLSGGQRQRIMLARMLLKPAKIILIDEGLNAVDINLERKILKNIFSKYSNHTIIVISHRMENIDLFNKVIYFENGTITNELSHPKEKLYD